MHIQATEGSGKHIWPWFVDNFTWLLLTFVLFGFALGETYRHLLGVATLIGIYQFARHPRQCLNDPATRLLLTLFLCLWVPMLVSLPDTQYLDTSLGTAARYVLYPFAGVAIVSLSKQADFEKKLLAGFAVVMLFWIFDGVFQAITGHNVLGYGKMGDRLTGMFNTRSRIGLVLVLLSPVYFEVLRRLSSRFNWAWLLLLPFVAVILLAGSRTTWMLLAFSIIAYIVYLQATGVTLVWRRWVIPGFVAIMLAAALIWQMDWLRHRVVAVTGVFSQDYQTANLATSLRLPLWETGWQMFISHPVNGIGPRAYGAAYAHYSPDPNAIVHKQPHLLLLEIAAETGLVGIILYLGFWYFLIRHMWSVRHTRAPAIPWGIAALVVAFPLSSALAFYAHFMSAFLWLFVIVYAALAFPPPTERK